MNRLWIPLVMVMALISCAHDPYQGLTPEQRAQKQKDEYRCLQESKYATPVVYPVGGFTGLDGRPLQRVETYDKDLFNRCMKMAGWTKP